MAACHRPFPALAILVALSCAASAAEADVAELEARLDAKLGQRRQAAVELATLYEAAGDSERAAAHYEMARRIHDNDFAVLATLIRLYRKPKDLPKLLSVYRSLARLQPTAVAWLRELGSCHFRLGQREQAEAVWRRIPQVHPTRASGAAYLARVYEQHRLFEEALAAHTEALSLAPQDRSIRLGFAEAQSRAGRHLGALVTLAPFKSAGRTRDGRRAELVRGRAFDNLKLPARSRRAVERMLAGKPRSAADLAWAIARWFEEEGSGAHAARFYGHVAKEEPATLRGKLAAKKARQLTSDR